MATVFVEPRHPGCFILSLEEGHFSYENGVILAGQVLTVGTVLGKVIVGGNEKYKVLTIGASDGSQNAAAVLFADVDASGGDTEQLIAVRDCEVIAGELVWPEGITDMQKAAATVQLIARGMIVR